MTVAGYFLRSRRRMTLLMEEPGVELGCKAILYGGGGLLLSAVPVRGGPSPVGAALAAVSPGLWVLAAALGVGAGYWLFWGPGPGLAWTAVAAASSLGLRKLRGRPLGKGICFGLLAGGTGLFFTGQPGLCLLWSLLGAGAAALLSFLEETGHPLALWMTFGLGIRAFGAAGLGPMASMAAGALGAAAPLPAAALAGMGLEAGGLPGMTAGLCLGWMVRSLPVKDLWRRSLGPALGTAVCMLLAGAWNGSAWAGVTLGGFLGAMLPWSWLLPPGTRGVSGAQVRLEQAAGALGLMQQRLLEMGLPRVREPSTVEQVQSLACDGCPQAQDCRARDTMDENLFVDPLSFSCPGRAQVLGAAARVRDRQRLVDAQRKRREEYRMAVAQQYGMLSRYLRRVADELPLGLTPGQIRYGVSVAVRSRRKDRVDGDRCAAFPGLGPRFYVLLCDGMGTGPAAAEEAQEAVELLKAMLTAGLPPGYAFKSLNAQLVLTGASGAVTADLAELRLDTGYACLYKWGGAQSWLLTRRRCRPLGTQGPPPGLDMEGQGGKISGLHLGRGENLILASDGLTFDPPPAPEETLRPPGDLARALLIQGTRNTQDDATLAVIRLTPKNKIDN